MELTITQLIKIILGVFLIVVVIGALYFVFKNYIIDFFKNLPGGNETLQIVLSLL